MKVKFLILTFFVATFAFSQKTEGVIYFKDGTKKVGYVKVGPKFSETNIGIKDKVKFRIDKKSKEISEFEYSNILKIDFIKKSKVIRTSYFKVPLNNPEVILEVSLEFEAEVNLYYHFSKAVGSNGYSSDDYYVQRGEDNIVKIFPVGIFGSGSEKAMMNYFGDCLKLVEHIKNETFKKYVENHPDFKEKSKVYSRMIEIVKYYNINCLENN